MSPASGFARHLPVVGGEEPLQRQPSGQHERAPQQVRRGPLPDAHRDGEQLQPDRVAAERVCVPGAAAARRQGQHAGAAGGNPGIQRERWVALAEVALRAAWTVRVAGGPQSCWYQVVCSAAAATDPAEHSGVWSPNTCLHTNRNLINHSCSSASGVKRSLFLITHKIRDKTVFFFLLVRFLWPSLADLTCWSGMEIDDLGLWEDSLASQFEQVPIKTGKILLKI